jgi:hypothetical protein
MPVSRLAHIPGIGVDEIGDAAGNLVFANEPIERLGDLRTRFDAALA